MNADIFRHLFEYHFAENRKLWQLVRQIPFEQFVQDVPYSLGSIRNQVLHLMHVDEVWFSELSNLEPPEPYQPANFDDREAIGRQWARIEQEMRAYLGTLKDEMLNTKPIREPEEDRELKVWQVLFHVLNHGTDHRAQILRLLHDLGVETTSQDYIFYAYEHL